MSFATALHPSRTLRHGAMPPDREALESRPDLEKAIAEGYVSFSQFVEANWGRSAEGPAGTAHRELLADVLSLYGGKTLPPTLRGRVGDPARMIELLGLFLVAHRRLRSRERVLLENLLLRKQLQVGPPVTDAVLLSAHETSSCGFSSTVSTETGDDTFFWSGPRPCCGGTARAGAGSGAGGPAARWDDRT